MSRAVEDWLPRHRITVHEYYRMGELGLFAPEARMELIEGEIIDVAPPGSRHASVVAQLNELLVQAVRGAAIVLVQSPVRLSELSEPQPDLALIRARDDRYRSSHPTGADALLVIEVSLTSWRFDRQVKIPLYARHGVPEVWIVDLSKDELHFFRSPRDGDYADVSSTSHPKIIQIPSLPGVSIDLSELFA
jgi:Uma2 family endonuclease